MEKTERETRDNRPFAERVGQRILQDLVEEYGDSFITSDVDIPTGYVDGKHVGVVSAASVAINRHIIRANIHPSDSKY